MDRFVGVLGIAVLLGLAFLFSTDRKAIQRKTVLWGLGLQLAFGVFILKFEIGRRIFQVAGDGINKLLSFAFAGSEFVFGEMGKRNSSFGFVFAFQVLPTIIFVAAIFAFLLSHWRDAGFYSRVCVVHDTPDGSEWRGVPGHCGEYFHGADGGAANDQAFLSRLTKSELMCVMTCGMAHVSGAIMTAYIIAGVEAKHLLAAVIMTCAGHAADCQDSGAGNGTTPHRRTGKDARNAKGSELPGSIIARDFRWLATGDQRGRDAHFLCRADGAAGLPDGRHAQLAAGASRAVVPFQPGTTVWVGICADCVADWHSLEGGGDRWKFAGDAHGVE